MVDLLQNTIDLVGYFVEVALVDPLNVALLLLGFLFVVAPSVIFFGIAAGGILDSVIPENLGRSPPQQGR